MMQEKDIKILFDAGALSRVSVIHMPVLAGFTYQFYYKEKKMDSVTMMTQRGEQKIGKTLDSAMQQLKRIGFQKFEVQY